MNSTNDTLALTLWILSELLGEIFASLVYILPLLGAVVILNIVFLWIFHKRIEGWHEILVLGYINARITWTKDKHTTLLWKGVHLLARQYFWIKNKFAR